MTCLENLPTIQGVPSLPSESLPVSTCDIFHLSWVLLSHGQTRNDCPYSHTMTHEGSRCSGEVAGMPKVILQWVQNQSSNLNHLTWLWVYPHLIVDFPQARMLSSFGGLTHGLQNFLSLWYLGQRSLKGDPDQMTTVSVSPRASWKCHFCGQWDDYTDKSMCLQAWWTEFHPWDQTQGTTHSTMSSPDHHMGCGLSLPNILLSNNHYNFERNANSWVLLCS